MKKNTETQYFSKSGLRSKKMVPAMNRKARNPQLESLEERHLLSAVSMVAAEDGIQAETFYVTLNSTKNDVDQLQYIAMHVQGDVDASDITITDKNGTRQDIIKSVKEDGVTTLLLRMGLGTDYTVTVNGVNKDNQISVLFTTPGDIIDGDGSVGYTEYYSSFGNVLKGQGISQRTAMMFQQQYGINISTLEFNRLLDLNSDGKLSQDEFNALVKGAYDSGLKIEQTIIVKPTLEGLNVNGTDATLTDEETQEYTVAQAGGEVEVSGKLPPKGSMTIVGEIEYTDVDGNLQTITIDDMYANDNELNYVVDADGNFTLTLKDVEDNSTISTTMSYAGTESSENTFTINLNTDAPTLVPGTLTLTSTSTIYAEKTYTADNSPNYLVSATGISQADYEKIVSEINSSSEGIWIVLEYAIKDGQTQKLEYKLTGKEFTQNGDTYDFSYAFTVPALADGVYTFTTYTRDLLNNKSESKTQEITIDTTKPTITAPGFLADYEGTMYVDAENQTLTIVVKDTNMKAPAETNPTVTLNGNTLTGTPTVVDGDVQYVFENFTLNHGENTIVFTVSDIAGNTESATYKYTYNQVPQITENGQKYDKQPDEYLRNDKDSKYIIENVASLFNETDGSTIDLDRITVLYDGQAVTNKNIDKNGNLVLTLNECNSTTIVKYTSNVTISYTDEHGKTAFYGEGDAKREEIEFTIHITNDVAAPVVSFTNQNEDFKGIINTADLTTNKDTAEIKLSITDKSEITSANVSITVNDIEVKNVTLEEFENSTATIKLNNLKNDDVIKISYTSADKFGNETPEAVTFDTITVDTELKGAIVTDSFKPTVATPTKDQPTLNFNVTNAGTEAMNREITYSGTTVDGKEVSGTFKAEFPISGNGIYNDQPGDETLADGTYTFTLTVWDNAGNYTTATIEDYVVDMTAPTAEITNTDPKTENESYTLNFNYADNLSGVEKLYLNGEEITFGESYEVTLKYGENTFTLVSEDAAGNKSEVSNTFTIIYNKKPVANTTNTGYKADASTVIPGLGTVDKAVFDQLLSVGFKETSGNYAGKIVLDLADYITDEKTLEQVGQIALTNNDAIESAEIVNGKLILDMEEVTLDNDLFATLNVTLKDEFDETIELQLNIEYIYDNEAPTVKPGNLTVTNNSAYEAGNFAIKDGNFTFNATITDDTAIVSAAWVLVGPDGNIIICGEGNITDTKTATATGTATLTTEGVYTLKFWGNDGITEASTETDPSVSYSITFDKTVPTFTGSVTLKNDATPTKETSQTFTITNGLTDASDCWLVIYDNGTEVKTVKAKNGVFPTEVTVDNLADGAHAFTYEIIDAASNKTDTATIGSSITVDTKPPVIDSITLVGNSLIVENSGSTTLNYAKFNFDIAETSEYTIQYSANGGKWTDYDAETGVTDLSFGDTKFQFKVKDDAGNETVWTDETGVNKVITVSYDHSPILTNVTLKDNSFTYPESDTVNTVTVTYTKAEIDALFNDTDANNGKEKLTYTFNFTSESKLDDAISLTKQELDGDNWVLTFTLNDKAAVRAVHTVGTLTVTLTDVYEQAITTEKATISKTNLPVDQVKLDTDPITQDVSQDNPSYTFDLSDYFNDPEGDQWTIESATVIANGTEDPCDISGKVVTWNPSAGKYGNATMTVTVKDGENEIEKKYTINVTIKWAGIQSVSAEKLSVAENSGMQTITVTAKNLFNPDDAWGGYTVDAVNWVVNVTNETANGNTVTTADGNRTQTQCTSLFVGEPTIADGEISFTLAENAYGNATLIFSANGVENTVVVEVTNTEVVPYTKPNLGYFPVNDESAFITQDSIMAGCDTDTDSGNVAFISMTLKETDTVKSTTVDGKNAINITKGDATYCILMENVGTDVKFTLYSVTEGNTTTLYADAADTVWEALDGVEIQFTYTVKNDSTGQTAENTYTLQFSAAAHSVTETVERAQEAQKVTILYSELCSEAGATIGAVAGLPEGYTYVVTDAGNIEITIPAYARGEHNLTYTLTLNGEEFSAHIYLNITDVNWAPTWSEIAQTEVVDGAYQWTVQEDQEDQTAKNPIYSLNMGDKIVDVNNDTAFNDLEIVVKEGYTVTDARTGYETTGTVTYDKATGNLIFTPDDKDFHGTVTVTLTVKDTAVGDAVAIQTDFPIILTINNKNDAPAPKEDANFIVSAKPGDVLNLQDLFGGMFTDPDGDAITIVSKTQDSAATISIASDCPMGVYEYTIIAKDGSAQTVEQKIYVAVGGETMIKDESLNPYIPATETHPAGTVFPSDTTVSEDIVLECDIKAISGTVLKAGTILKAGTVIPKNTTFYCNGDPTEFTSLGATIAEFGETEDGDLRLIFRSEYTLTEDITLSQDMSLYGKTSGNPKYLEIKTGSKILAGSNFAKDSSLLTELVLNTQKADTDTIIKIYEATREITNDGTVVEHTVYLEHDLGLTLDSAICEKLVSSTETITVFSLTVDGNREAREIQVVSTATDPNSPFQYIGYDATTGKFSVYYLPYDVTQDRTEEYMKLTFNGGTEMSIKVSTDFVKPFEIVTGIVEGATVQDNGGNLPTSFDTDDFIDYASTSANNTYSYQVWLQCNLPIFNKDVLSYYQAFALYSDVTVFLKGVNVLNTQDIRSGNREMGTDGFEKFTLTANTLKALTTSGAIGDGYCNEDYLLSYLNFTAAGPVEIGETVSNSTMAMVINANKAYGENYPGIGLAGSKIDTAGNITGAGVISQAQTVITDYSNRTPVKGNTANRETVVEGNGVYMSVVKDKSDVETSDTLRESDAYITEWDSSWVELWVNTQEIGTDISSFDLNLLYNTDYFTATGFEYSTNVLNGNEVTINDANGKVSGIRGDLMNAITREDGFVLLGRVQLESVGTDNVAADTLNSVSMGLQLSNVLLRDSATALLQVNEQVYVNTKVFASVYDANDDGLIDIKDLVLFAHEFGQNSVDTTDARIWAMDFNNSGKIDINDLVSFAQNYNVSRDSNVEVMYPMNFFQTWIGATLDTEGDSNVADTLNDAILSWSEKLGEELNLNVQIIVKDYENVDGGCLAETLLLGCDEFGKPNSAVVYLDSDALGMGWYAGSSDNVISDQYDLYSVLLHELGHALGMSPSYDGYNSLIDGTTSTYKAEDGNVHYIFNGHVVTNGDLMNDMIGTGIRHEISDLDAEIVANARKEGGSVNGVRPDAISGTVACTLGSEVQNGILLTTASNIMAESDWNAMLVESATQAVEQATVAANEQAWEEWTPAEAKTSVNPSMVDSVMEDTQVNLATAVSEVPMDDLFNDDDFARELEDIAQETLRIQLNDQE
ncbi:MAG: hypothetical protein Q4C70_00370 [Planctomycetia bacterium]|nr:hypothetical protein [Planctomycetia bacterium]